MTVAPRWTGLMAGVLQGCWLVMAALGVTAATAVRYQGDYACESRVIAESNYGELEWSVLPPGPRCSWTVEANGFADSRGPSPVWSMWLLILLALGWITVVARRRARRAVARTASHGS